MTTTAPYNSNQCEESKTGVCIAIRGCTMFEETEARFIVRTEDGLHARVFYDWNDGPEFEVYPQGNKKYALVAFYIYMTNLLKAEKPAVKYVGSVSELSRN